MPGYLVYRYIRKINYLNKSGSGLFPRVIRLCFGEDETITPTAIIPTVIPQRTAFEEAFLLLFYFFGLQISYLSWGVLQEKVMTQEYVSASGEIEYFKDSQFLVFVNRVLAFTMSGMALLCRRQPRHKCPFYKYVFCSFSNIMSSWCQYEALKYVSFPHQVLAKAAKVIPVMIMGKIISKTKYEFYEYVTAVILSVGMLFFMLDSGNDRAKSTVTTFSGILLLCSYIAFDSFTSNWQGALFRTYSMKPVQMMCFVNFYSCIFTVVSLIQQGSFWKSGSFMIKYPSFIVDCILLSICSASGQLFIYSTLSVFGPLVFAIITTIRQGFSVLLSCIIYHHNVNALGIFGLGLVFFSILLRIYCGHRLKTIRKLQSDSLKAQSI
ncbi:hypothetical protein HHI36_022829 [Cryptolaemus montrouzieri]|uniref:Adenosine 3'-phospho 5'-phosphosulfate transporter 1 n=1 Tax=Cryptolaemus montrouzieri TaxID=559131 RepID=A0ABD2PEJ3_9CUCU